MKVKTEQREITRKRLLEEAAAHFSRLGYEATNVNDVAISAGYAKGTIYNYFRSKEELFGEVVSEAARRTVERYSSMPGFRSVRESLRYLVEADISVMLEEEPFMKVLVGEAVDPKSGNYTMILEHLSPFLEVISGILAEGLERNEIRRDRPVQQLSLLFMGLLSLLYTQYWKTEGSWPPLEEIPELVVTFFLDGAGSPLRNGERQDSR